MRATRDLLIFHLLFGAAAAAAFLELHAPWLGRAVLALIVAYQVGMAWVTALGGHHEDFALWAFLLPLSVFQVAPDWVLSQLLGILEFPELGGPRLGTVPLYMAGMWVPPLFWILRLTRGAGEYAAAALALVVFGAAEWAARPFHLWHAVGVPQSYGVAHYVLLPEAVLGGAALFAFKHGRDSGVLGRIVLAAGVSALYTGALVLAYFFSVRAEWTLR